MQAQQESASDTKHVKIDVTRQGSEDPLLINLPASRPSPSVYAHPMTSTTQPCCGRYLATSPLFSFTELTKSDMFEDDPHR